MSAILFIGLPDTDVNMLRFEGWSDELWDDGLDEFLAGLSREFETETYLEWFDGAIGFMLEQAKIGTIEIFPGDLAVKICELNSKFHQIFGKYPVVYLISGTDDLLR